MDGITEKLLNSEIFIDEEKRKVVNVVNKWKDTCIATACKHYFHIECFKEWITTNQKCPTCNTDLKKFSMSAQD